MPAAERLTRSLVDRLRRDFTGSGLPADQLRLVRASEWDEIVPAIGGRATGAYSVSEYVLLVGRRSFVLDLSVPAQAIAAAASALADDVMDQAGRPWPELTAGGVLEARVDELGEAVWASATGVLCPIGYLQQALGRTGLIRSLP
jgi:hypothetical protein